MPERWGNEVFLTLIWINDPLHFKAGRCPGPRTRKAKRPPRTARRSGQEKRAPWLTFPDVVESLGRFGERLAQPDWEADTVLFDELAQIGQCCFFRLEERPMRSFWRPSATRAGDASFARSSSAHRAASQAGRSSPASDALSSRDRVHPSPKRPT